MPDELIGNFDGDLHGNRLSRLAGKYYLKGGLLLISYLANSPAPSTAADVPATAAAPVLAFAVDCGVRACPLGCRERAHCLEFGSASECETIQFADSAPQKVDASVRQFSFLVSPLRCVSAASGINSVQSSLLLL